MTTLQRFFSPPPTVSCPHCGCGLEYDPALEGQQVICPDCKGPILFCRPTEHEIALAAIKAKRTSRQNDVVLLCYIAGFVLCFVFLPLGIVVIILGLVLSALNKR